MEEEDRGQGPGGPAENSQESPAVEDAGDDGFSFPAPPLLSDACVVPVYPIFGRPPFPAAAGEKEEQEGGPETATLRVPLGRLLLEEREFRARQPDGRSVSARHRRRHEEEEEEDEEEASAGAGAGEELEGVPPESYCLWAPGGQASSASPRRCRKSGSTGSVLRWRRISDRLVGRSHSDGKEKFVFLDAPAALPLGTGGGGSRKDEQQQGGKGEAAAADPGRSLRYYNRGGGAGGSGRRRSYLPYKQELVGLFANVSGLRRSYHPF